MYLVVAARRITSYGSCRFQMSESRTPGIRLSIIPVFSSPGIVALMRGSSGGESPPETFLLIMNIAGETLLGKLPRAAENYEMSADRHSDLQRFRHH